MDEEKFRETYRAEAFEMLNDLEEALLELEIQPGVPKLINRIFRTLHTIKGSGKMFGFDDIAGFVHALESVYEEIRYGRLTADQKLISLTLSSCDIIRGMLDGKTEDSEKRTMITDQLQSILGEKSEEIEQLPESTGKNRIKEHPITIFRISFVPMQEIFRAGNNLIPLLNELRDMGQCTVVCHHDGIPAINEFDPESCYLRWDIILTTHQNKNDIRDVFIFVESECKLDITIITDADNIQASKSHKLLGEILVDKKEITSEELKESLRKKPLFGQILIKEKLVDESKVEAAVAEQQHTRNLHYDQSTALRTNSLRVPAQKLDALVDLVGELVIAQARLSQHASTSEDAVAANIAEEVERLTIALRDNTISMRMLPIDTIFGKFKRMIRDLSVELNKKIELVVEGGETELDKTVLDQLDDPLVHILRNSIDHGIESPEERTAKGKASVATIGVAAAHDGGNVMIRITDDGAGLDAGSIRSRAIEQGIISPDTELTDDETFNLILEPGFSTAVQVTDVSGRGVGMDVVRRRVAVLHGTLGIQSEPGSGTAITIKLPLTLAIIDGLLTETGGEMYVIPQTAVIKCFEQTHEDIQKAHGNDVIEVSGRMLPYICLRTRFSIKGDVPPSRRIIMCEANDGKIGIAVDRIIGSYQTVIKPLGNIYNNIECFAGATILGDGTVALIIDPIKLRQKEISGN
ncbi:chemotaxis protein CheA [Desulfobacterales bacterium HSG16]|nr:chemotaxis protein CheA [Desulfobacterales bacterium HSG16]